jgi:ABC-2 type transport system ATP-binding protein
VEFEPMPGSMVRAHTAQPLPLAPLVRFFEDNAVDVTEARAIRPSLEDVFVRITGVALDQMRKEKEQARPKGGNA